MSKGWLVNDTPAGCWAVFHLFNQGEKVVKNCNKVPETLVSISTAFTYYKALVRIWLPVERIAGSYSMPTIIYQVFVRHFRTVTQINSFCPATMTINDSQGTWPRGLI